MKSFSPPLRKLALTAHIVTSVGWLGAVLCFLALAVVGLRGEDPLRARAAYLAMELVAWAVIVPLGFASPLSGVVMSLGTAWGLVRHYWVLAKVVLTVPATAILLLHMRPITHMAHVSAMALPGDELGRVKVQLVASAGAAVVVLLVATLLSVFKPRGMTPYGRRMRAAEAKPT